ncbi:MAG: biotin/lipoyl-containing protein [Candidatus Kryptonium sp.]|nr:biotin/lipoyl-binding protein [Candidatus Kryptonium sp.]MDW8109191.1 biotin/lipoyl-containing protein [Candidatus Kryptonium sp.]
MKLNVNDLSLEIDIKKTNPNKFEVKIGDNQHKVEILNITDNQITILIGNRVFTFNFALSEDSIILSDSLNDYHCKATSKYQEIINSYRSTSSGEAKKEKLLKSPMPGLITKIFVKPGTKIKVGDKLLILEAMKMENEIRSDLDGVVEEVLVNEGTAVEKGSSLLKISTN